MNPAEETNRTRAQHRFAVAGMFLALAAGLGTPALARFVSRVLSDLPTEVGLVALGFVVALVFLAIGWVLGRRADPRGEEARRSPSIMVGGRRQWDERLAHEVDCAVRAKMPLSLLILDVDHLKRLNETAGREAGDAALSIVADSLQATCRSRDVVARLGGDELAVLLPRTHASEARIVAERIRGAIAYRRRAHGAPLDRHVTVSIGICDLSSLDEPHPQLFFNAADRALYAAKQNGRDRIEIGHRKMPPRSSSTVIVLDPRRRPRKKNPRRTSI